MFIIFFIISGTVFQKNNHTNTYTNIHECVHVKIKLKISLLFVYDLLNVQSGHDEIFDNEV